MDRGGNKENISSTLVLVDRQKKHKKKKSFPCPYSDCKKCYTSNSHLKEHLIDHSGERFN